MTRARTPAEIHCDELGAEIDAMIADYSKDHPLMSDPELLALAQAAVDRIEARKVGIGKTGGVG